MSDDVRRVIYGTLIGFLAIVLSWLALIYVSSCGFTLNCYQASPLVIRTAIPTLIPVSHEVEGSAEMPEFEGCLVSGTDLIGAWVTAGSPESEPFPFNDVNGDPCEGTYADDIQHLFVDNSVWYTGQLGCTSCHNADLTERSARLDLSSFEGVMMGAQNESILGNGDWESSSLHTVLVTQGLGPDGHDPDAEPIGPILIYAGMHAAEEAAATATPAATATATP